MNSSSKVVIEKDHSIRENKITKSTIKERFVDPSIEVPYAININQQQELLKILSQEWDKHNIDMPIRKQYEAFISKLSPEKAYSFISKEIKSLQSSSSFLQISLKSINSREESLRSIKEMNKFLSKTHEWYKNQSIALECAEILHGHRMITLLTAENIEKLYLSLFQECSDFDFDLIYEGVSYLNKIKTDSDFLSGSEMSKVFKFSKKSDPFIIIPSEDYPSSNRSKSNQNYFFKNSQVSIPLPFGIIKRINEINGFINTGKPNAGKVKIHHTPSAKRSATLTPKLSDLIIRAIFFEMVDLKASKIVSKVVKEYCNEYLVKFFTNKLIDCGDLVKKIAIEAKKEVKAEVLENKLEDKQVKIASIRKANDLEVTRSKSDNKAKFEKLKNKSKRDYRFKSSKVHHDLERSFLNKLNKKETLVKPSINDPQPILEKKTKSYRPSASNSHKTAKLVDEIHYINEIRLKKVKGISDKDNKPRYGSPLISLSKNLLSIKSKNSVNLKSRSPLSRINLTSMETSQKINLTPSTTDKNVHNLSHKDLPKTFKFSSTKILNKEKIFNLENNTELGEHDKNFAEILIENDEKNHITNLPNTNSVRESVRKSPEKFADECIVESNEAVISSGNTPGPIYVRQSNFNTIEESSSSESIERPDILKNNLVEQKTSILSAAEARSSINSKNLLDSIFAEGIIRNYIEELINSLDLIDLIDSIIKEMLIENPRNVKKSNKLLDLTKVIFLSIIKNSIYDSLLDDFTSEQWLIDLASTLINHHLASQSRKSGTLAALLAHSATLHETEDNVHEIFTPGVHSPNSYCTRNNSHSESLDKISISSEYTQRNIQNSDIGRRFGPINANRSNILIVLSEYYEKLVDPVKQVIFGAEEVIRLAECGEDACWYWGMDGADITSCLIFSTNCFESEKSADIHHFSVTDITKFESMLKLALKIIESQRFNAINACFLKNNSPIFTNHLESHNFRFIQVSTNTPPYYTLKLPPSKHPSHKCSFTLNTSIETTLSNTLIPPQTSQDMLEYGNRICLLSHLHNLSQDSSSADPSSASTRLHQDLLELLEISLSFSSSSFPYTHFNSSQPKTSMSLTFSYYSCCYFQHSYLAKTYYFMRFTQVILSKSDRVSIYSVKTTDPLVEVRFIVSEDIRKELKAEMLRAGTDVYCKAEGILRTANEGKAVSELWVPVFDKGKKWEVEWVHGLRFAEEELAVAECREDVRVEHYVNGQAKALLGSKKPNRIFTEFLFVIIHKTTQDQLEVPTFVCLVTKEDWKIAEV